MVSFPNRLACSLLLGAAVASCSPSTGQSRSGLAGDGSVSTGGASGSGAGAGSGIGIGGDPGGSLVGVTGNGSGGSGRDACATTSASAEQTVKQETIVTKSPVALYLVQDRSGSMTQTPPGSPASKWTQTTSAVNAFVNDPGSDGLDVALGFFPLTNAQCIGTGYDTPIVPMGKILNPAQAQLVATALTGNAPGGGGGLFGGGGGGTPLEGGLRGGVNFCMTYQPMHPGERCVVVLITDGAPNGCSADPAVLSGIAADAHTRANVLTFAIGMNGADFNLMNLIATAGGTDCSPNVPGGEACNVDVGGTSFLDALNLIRTTVSKVETKVLSTRLACEYGIPAATGGQKFDRNKVNVQYTSAAGAEKILQVPTPADCTRSGGKGWYYDDPITPKKVLLCPASCKEVGGGADGGVTTGSSTVAPRLDVLFGCVTELAVPA